MSDWPRVIEAMGSDLIVIDYGYDSVALAITSETGSQTACFTINQCAALIAAITDAAKVVTGDRA